MNLTLKKKWFDLIDFRVKKEEYREIKPYWFNRLFQQIDGIIEEPANIQECCDELKAGLIDIEALYEWSGYVPAQYSKVSATNGYGKHRPNIAWKHEGIRIGTPNPAWCEPEDIGKTVFILSIGELQLPTL